MAQLDRTAIGGAKREGFRPAKRTSRFGPTQVRHLINQHAIRSPAARRCSRPPRTRPSRMDRPPPRLGPGMHTATVYNWIYRGWLTARRDGDHWIITADQHELELLRERRDRPPGYYTHARACRDAHCPRSRALHGQWARRRRDPNLSLTSRRDHHETLDRWDRLPGPHGVTCTTTVCMALLP